MYMRPYFFCITGEHMHMSGQSQGRFVSMQISPKFLWVSLNFEICVIVLIYFTAFQESG